MRRTMSLLIPWTFVAFTLLCLAGNVARCAEVIIEDNITYGKAGDTDLKLDLARPRGNGPFPAIVFIHGGGWYQGSRQEYRGEIQEAARRGYVAATISYRLMKFDESKKETTTATQNFPAQIHDAQGGHPLGACQCEEVSRRTRPDRGDGRFRRWPSFAARGAHRSFIGPGRRKRKPWTIEPGAGRRQLFRPN